MVQQKAVERVANMNDNKKLEQQKREKELEQARI